MKRAFRRIALSILAVLLYITLFPLRTGPEIVIEPVWATNPASASVVAGQPPLLPVRFDRGFAYVTVDGEVAYRGRSAFGVALSADSFINYPQNPVELVVQDTDGEFLESIPLAGHPIMRDDRTFVVSQAGTRLVEWRDRGAGLDLTLPAPLLDLDAGASLLVAGLALGEVAAYRLSANDGSASPFVLEEASPGRDATILRVVLSDDESRLAVMATADPGESQTVTLYDLGLERGIPIVRRTIAADSQARPFLHLAADGSRLWYAASTGGSEYRLVVLDPSRGIEAAVAIPAPARKAVEITSDSREPLTFVLIEDEKTDPSRGFMRPARLLAFTADGMVPFSANWFGLSSSIVSIDDLLVITVDDRMLAARVSVR